MIHVCHFCESNVEGHYFKNISRGLVQKGIKVTCLELGPYKPPKWLEDVPQVNYRSLGITSRLQYPIAVVRLAKLIRNEKVDILQTHLFYAGLIGVLAKRLYRNVFVALTRHHTSIVRDLGKGIHIAMDKWMAKNADRAVGVSKATKQFMVEVDGIPEDHVDVVYLGFDFDSLASGATKRKIVRDEFGLEQEAFVIGYVGNFARRKGHIQLVQAFARIVESVPEARLLLIGTGSLPEVNEEVGRLGLKDKVIFAGWRNDIPACFAAMDLFVQPSLSEAFSQVIIEAMGAGIPVVATEVGGANEVINNGENGFLVQPDDIDDLVDKSLMLFRDQALRERFSTYGRTAVSERFSVEKLVDRQFELYNDWVGREVDSGGSSN